MLLRIRSSPTAARGAAIDGTEIEGWFTEDFTLAELKTLRARERIPQVRPANTRFDGQFEIPTFEEILVLVRAGDELRAARARQLGLPVPARIGVYPETKHPTYFAGRGLALEAPIVEMLARHGYRDRSAPVWLQSFEVGSLVTLSHLTQLPRVQLMDDNGAPYDFVTRHDSRTYADMSTPAGLAEVARYAQAIGPNKSQVIPRKPDGSLGTPTAAWSRTPTPTILRCTRGPSVPRISSCRWSCATARCRPTAVTSRARSWRTCAAASTASSPIRRTSGLPRGRRS